MLKPYPLTIDQVSGTVFKDDKEWPDILRGDGVSLTSSLNSARAISSIVCDYLESYSDVDHEGDYVAEANFYRDVDETDMLFHLEAVVRSDRAGVVRLATLACEALRGIYSQGVNSAIPLSCNFHDLRVFRFCGHQIRGGLHIEVQYPIRSDRTPGTARQFIYLDLDELDNERYQLKRELIGAMARQAFDLEYWNVWVLNVCSRYFELAKEHDLGIPMLNRHIQQLNIASQIEGLRRNSL